MQEFGSLPVIRWIWSQCDCWIMQHDDHGVNPLWLICFDLFDSTTWSQLFIIIKTVEKVHIVCQSLRDNLKLYFHCIHCNCHEVMYFRVKWLQTRCRGRNSLWEDFDWQTHTASPSCCTNWPANYISTARLTLTTSLELYLSPTSLWICLPLYLSICI